MDLSGQGESGGGQGCRLETYIQRQCEKAELKNVPCVGTLRFGAVSTCFCGPQRPFLALRLVTPRSITESEFFQGQNYSHNQELFIKQTPKCVIFLKLRARNVVLLV